MQTRKLALPIIFFLFLSLFSRSVYAVDVEITQDGGYADTNRSTWQGLKALHPSSTTAYSAVGQSFATLNDGHQYTLKSLAVSMYKVGSPTGNAYAKLYAHQGTFGTSSLPSGSALATSDAFDVSSLPTSYVNGEYTSLTFSDAYNMSANTYYVITFENPTSGTIDNSNYVQAGIDATSPTHEGNYMSYRQSAWTALSSADLCAFYVYGEQVVAGGQNLNFNLTAVPSITATLVKGIEIFNALSGAPAFTSSITYGLEWLFNLSEIPAETATLVYARALALSFSEIPKFIADLVAEKGKNAIFDLSVIPAIITDLAKNMELKRSLSEIPKFIVDLTREIELGFVEFILTEVPIFTATLGFLVEAGMTTSDLANGAIALALIALIFALCGIGLAVKKAND